MHKEEHCAFSIEMIFFIGNFPCTPKYHNFFDAYSTHPHATYISDSCVLHLPFFLHTAKSRALFGYICMKMWTRIKEKLKRHYHLFTRLQLSDSFMFSIFIFYYTSRINVYIYPYLWSTYSFILSVHACRLEFIAFIHVVGCLYISTNM